MDKPWNTDGISGVQTFMRKAMNLFTNNQDEWIVTDDAPTPEELKVLHKTIKKVEEDLERDSFNTPTFVGVFFPGSHSKKKRCRVPLNSASQRQLISPKG